MHVDTTSVYQCPVSFPLGTQKTMYQLGGAVWFWPMGCEREGHVSLLGGGIHRQVHGS